MAQYKQAMNIWDWTKEHREKQHREAVGKGVEKAKRAGLTDRVLHDAGDVVTALIPASSERESEEAGYHGYVRGEIKQAENHPGGGGGGGGGGDDLVGVIFLGLIYLAFLVYAGPVLLLYKMFSPARAAQSNRSLQAKLGIGLLVAVYLLLFCALLVYFGTDNLLAESRRLSIIYNWHFGLFIWFLLRTWCLAVAFAVLKGIARLLNLRHKLRIGIPAIVAPLILVSFAARNPARLGAFLPHVGIAAVAMCSEIKGPLNYRREDWYYPGDAILIHANAVNVNQRGRMDLTFDIRIVDSADTPIVTSIFNQGTNQAGHDPNWSLENAKLDLPSGVHPGVYTVRVGVLNNLTGQVGLAHSRIRILPWKPLAEGAVQPDIGGIWQGRMNGNGRRESPVKVQLQQRGAELTGYVQEAWGSYSYEVVGRLKGASIRFGRSPADYAGELSRDGTSMSGIWTNGTESGVWRATRLLHSGGLSSGRNKGQPTR